MTWFLRMFKRKEPREISIGIPASPDDAVNPDYEVAPGYIPEPVDLDDRYRLGSYCFVCAHFHGAARLDCTAFPEGIPPEVWNGRHTTPYPGDNGILFEPREDGFNPFAPKEEQEKQRQQKEQKQ